MSRRTLATIAAVVVTAGLYGGASALAMSYAATTPTPKPKVVRGPVGPAGPQGQPGERGLPGRDGRDGVGIPGPQGVAGQNGRDGSDGKDGANGKDGFILPSGTILLIAGECPSGTTVQGNPLQWRVYNGNPFTGSGSELYASACRFN